MHPFRFRIPLLLFVLISSASSRAASPAVEIVRKPVSVAYRTYPPGHPPPTLHSLETSLGVCNAEFGEIAQCHAQYFRFGPKSNTASVSAVKITLSLDVTIWLAEGSGTLVLAHEEAHRSIAERYYQWAEISARRAGERAAQRTLKIAGKNKAQAVQKALGMLSQEIVDEIHRAVYERCKYAEERFDEVTDHGRSKVPINDAKTTAIADEQKRWDPRDQFN